MKHALAMLATSACGSSRQLVRASLKRPLLFLAAAVLGLMLGSVQSAEAATCNVPGTYPTIQMAVNDPSCDPIIVAAGLYPEEVTIQRTLTLRGAQAGVDARTRPFVAANESIIDHPCGPVQIEADSVTIDGFTVQGSALSDPCFLAGIWTNPGFSGTQGGHQILNNIVQNNISGIELDSTCAASPTLVQFNLVQNNDNPGPGSGNGIQTNFGLCKATIDSNKFSGHTNSSLLVVAASSDLTVSNNELVAGTLERIVFATVSNSTVSGNVSTGSTSSGTIRLFGGDSDIAINSNTLLNGMRGIRVDDPYGIGANSGVTAHQNCIKGNLLAGLDDEARGHLGTLHAENNWWGSSTGPMNVNNPGGTGDAVVDPDGVVDFTPWLTSPPGPPCPAAPNTPGKATGGGKIESSSTSTSLDTVLSLATLLITSSSHPISVGSQATFGFSVACCAPKGNLEYNDHPANITIKATSIITFVISPSSACPTGKHAQFMGMAKQNGTSVNFTVDVDDCGEPGSSPTGGPDMFKIQTSAGYVAGGPLIGGNIQIKQ